MSMDYNEHRSDVQAAAKASSPDIPLTETPPVWTSPSFWVTILPVISAVIGFFLHKQIDLSGQSAAIGLIGASLAAGLLAVSRAIRHKAVLEANSRTQSMRLEQQANQRVVLPVDPYGDVFRDIEHDMRAHNERLKKLESAAKKTPTKKTAAAKKTATARRTTALDMSPR